MIQLSTGDCWNWTCVERVIPRIVLRRRESARLTRVLCKLLTASIQCPLHSRRWWGSHVLILCVIQKFRYCWTSLCSRGTVSEQKSQAEQQVILGDIWWWRRWVVAKWYCRNWKNNGKFKIASQQRWFTEKKKVIILFTKVICHCCCFMKVTQGIRIYTCIVYISYHTYDKVLSIQSLYTALSWPNYLCNMTASLTP